MTTVDGERYAAGPVAVRRPVGPGFRWAGNPRPGEIMGSDTRATNTFVEIAKQMRKNLPAIRQQQPNEIAEIVAHVRKRQVQIRRHVKDANARIRRGIRPAGEKFRL